MPDAPHPPVFAEALIFLAAGVVAVPVFRKLRLGSILGYLAAGLSIGPFGLGLFSDSHSVMNVAELGVVLFLFVIGLELNLSRLWAMRHDIFVLGGAQVVLTGGLAMIYPLLVVGRPWRAALIAGLGLALSSTALVMQLLEERGEVQQPHGQKAFAILLLQDLAIVPLLALVALFAPVAASGGPPLWLTALKMAGAVGAVVLVGRYLLNPFFRVLANAGAREVMTGAALLVVIAAAVLMTYVGLSAALGAFLAGVMLAESSYRHELEADIDPFRGLLLGLFFMSVGMTVDLRVVAANWKLLAGALLTLTLIKISVVYGLLRLLRNRHDVSIRTALHLPQGGEFGFVLFSTAVSAGVMPAIQGTLLVALVTLSMALTPLLVALAPRLARSRTPSPERPSEFDGATRAVLMIGFGRFGQLACQLLLHEGVDVTIIDTDVEMIDAAERFGFKLYYGDGTRLDVLRAAGADRARMICICVERKEQATRIVELCGQAFPLARLYVRAYDRVRRARAARARRPLPAARNLRERDRLRPRRAGRAGPARGTNRRGRSRYSPARPRALCDATAGRRLGLGRAREPLRPPSPTPRTVDQPTPPGHRPQPRTARGVAEPAPTQTGRRLSVAPLTRS